MNPFASSDAARKRARAARRTGNPAEVRLWFALRTRPGGFKFRRQHPIGPFNLDFACLEARVAIEVDGEVHERGENVDRDAARDAALIQLGFFTLRLPARHVFADLDAVVALIVDTCRQRLTPPPLGCAERSPSPCRGGSKESHP